MSKYVKNLITEHLRQRLDGVRDALLVDVVGLKANTAHRLRSELRSKNINLMVVKNSLARRAVAGTPLAGLFDGIDGSAAVCWGGEDVVVLAKEVVRCAKDAQYTPFKLRRGVVDGQPFTADQIEDVSKWPTRTEMLSILVGQLLSPAYTLCGQLSAQGAALLSQIEQAAEKTQASGETQAVEQTSSAEQTQQVGQTQVGDQPQPADQSGPAQ